MIYVDQSATGANNGTSWQHAFVSLSNALAIAANGDEVWVSKGTYKPETQIDLDGGGGSDPREVAFRIPNGVKVYGGFEGTELSRNERDWIANVTVLSGDIDNNDKLTGGITYYVDDIAGSNAYHVIYTVNAGPGTRVDGFTINAGSANMPETFPVNPNARGGGWYNDLKAPSFASSPTLANNLFQANYARYGGGFYSAANGNASGEMLSLIWHCNFKYNGALDGGGMSISGTAAANVGPVIRGGEFFGNEALNSGGAMDLSMDHAIVDSVKFIGNRTTVISDATSPGAGGAVYMNSSNAVFTTCYFAFNHATGNSTGAKEGGGGGAVYIKAWHDSDSPLQLVISDPGFFNCVFYANTTSGNSGAWGGAVLHYNESGILRPRYINCVFSANSAKTSGSAVANYIWVTIEPQGYTPALEPLFVNCTFSNNHAGSGKGPISNSGWVYKGAEVLDVTVVNSVLAGNTGDENTYSGPAGNPTFSYSLIEGSGGSGSGWDQGYGVDGGFNLDANPFFTDQNYPPGPDNVFGTTDDGLRLSPGSPAVNHGNLAAPGLLAIATDITGEPRVQGFNVDMGAYENAGITIFPIFLLSPWEPIPVGCLSCPWSFKFGDEYLDTFDWDGPAHFTDRGDHGVITGTIVNREERRVTFDVYMKLTEPNEWNTWSEMGRSWLVFTPEAQRVALQAHERWKYWELSEESYLRGSGDVTGTLHLRHAPEGYRTGFQLGEGANGYDGDLGLSGAFYYEGELAIGRENLFLRGHGSLNVDAAMCVADCFQPVEQPVERQSKPEVDESRNSSFVYPNPAHDRIEINAPQSPGSFQILIYDQFGQLRQSNQAEALEGTIRIDLLKQPPGIHYLHLIAPSGESRYQKFVIE